MPGNGRVTKIEKVKNRAVQMRFLNELKIVQQKNRNKPLNQIVRLLFHGTRATCPKEIATGENGLSV
jgi:hypothetical protein